MPLFQRDREYGGTYMDDAFPLIPLEGNAKVMAQSDEFVVWDCNGIVAEAVATSIGEADKVEFIVSSIETPNVRFPVVTFASAIVDKVRNALDEANGDVKAAFSDLPAIARLQSVKSSRNRDVNALVLSWTCSVDDHARAAHIKTVAAQAPDGSDHPFDEDEVADARQAAAEAKAEAKTRN